VNPGLFSIYEGAPLPVQAHVRVRWLSCPLRSVAARVPARGRVLEVGCGHGLFSLHMALEERGRSVLGVDVDVEKVVLGQRAAKVAERRGATVELQLAPPGEIPAGPWDAIVIVDVLYLLAAEAQFGLVATCAAELAAGGVLVVKEMDVEPAWKARWNRVQETLAVRVLRITAGETLTFLPPSALRSWMEAEGLVVTEESLGGRYPHPHHLTIGRRPTLAEMRDLN